jgi:hypothetical protein
METSTAAARTCDTARDRRIDYGRFDWAKARSLDMKNSEDDSIEFPNFSQCTLSRYK